MRFSSAISIAPSLEQACHEAADRARPGLGTDPVDLCLAFVSTRYRDRDRAAVLLHERLAPRALVGCTGGGIIGGEREVEGRAAVSVLLASLPGVTLTTHRLQDADLPDDDAPPAAWVDLFGRAPDDVVGFVVLPEPFTFAAHRLLNGLDFAYSRAVKIGGVASGSQHPGAHALYCGREAQSGGAVVLALGGAIVIEPRVAQGCKPFGRVGRITRAHHNHLQTVDGRPALRFVEEQLATLRGADRELAQAPPVVLGIAMDPFATALPKPGDFLIRNVMGYDPEQGTLTIGELLSVGRAVQLHLRDRDASADDLRTVLERGERARRAAAGPPRGALMFSCLGRGRHLYGEEGFDSRVFREVVGAIPLGGFFCNGEIGPVQGTTHLHGFTAAFALLSEKVS